MNIFGNKDALIGSLDLMFGAIYVLGALIFRKSVANDMMDTGFSVIGASACSCIAFVLVKSLTNWSIKIPFAIGIGAWVAGGLLLANLIGDGWVGGGE